MSHRARMLVLLVAILAMPAAAFAGSITGVEGTLNTVFQKDQTSFSGIGMRLHMRAPGNITGLSLVPTIQYWNNHSTFSSFGITSSRSDATLGIESRYAFTGVQLQPYFGLGYGLHFLSSEVTAPGVNGSDSVTKGAMSLLGGISVPLAGSLQNDFGAQYDFMGDGSQFKLNWGFRYSF